MSDVPSNLIPTRITQLPYAPAPPSLDGILLYVYQGNSYQVRAADLVSVSGVPPTRQVIAGIGLSGGGALSSDITLSVTPNGIGTAQLAASGVTSGIYGDSTHIPVIRIDATGRVTSASVTAAPAGSGTVTTVSVVSANGFTGTVANNATTPAITLTTSITGILKGNGTSLSAAIAADFPILNQNTTGTSANVTGTVAVANGGTGVTTSTGSGNTVLSTSPTLVTPVLGTPTSGTLTNCTFPTLNQDTTGTAATVTGLVTVNHGGTGAATLTANNVLLGNGTSAVQAVAPSTSGNVLTSNGTTWQSTAPAAGGVSSFSAGSTGLTPNTATTGVVTLAGTLAVANGGTGLTTFTTANNALYSTSAGALVAGTLPVLAGGTGVTTSTGTTNAVLSDSPTLTGKVSFNGSTSQIAAILANAAETTNITAAALTGVLPVYLALGAVQYYTAVATGSWTPNISLSSLPTTLNAALAIGQSTTVAFMATQGTTAYFSNALQIDGVAVTPKWQGGAAPTAGNVSGIDVYTYTIVKTAASTYTVLASMTQFK